MFCMRCDASMNGRPQFFSVDLQGDVCETCNRLPRPLVRPDVAKLVEQAEADVARQRADGTSSGSRWRALVDVARAAGFKRESHEFAAAWRILSAE